MNDEKKPLLTGPNSPDENIEARKISISAVNLASTSVPVGDDKSKNDYRPGAERTLEYPTSNFDTLIHLLKANIGTGILAMPDAFKNAGLLFEFVDNKEFYISAATGSLFLGLVSALSPLNVDHCASLYQLLPEAGEILHSIEERISGIELGEPRRRTPFVWVTPVHSAAGVFSTIIMGAICTHCMQILVECSHELCIKNQRPALNFAEVVEDAFSCGPVPLRPYAKKMRNIVNVFLVITQLGFCCVYFLFVATNLQDTFPLFQRTQTGVFTYLVLLLPLLCVLSLVKNLKYLSPVSLLASIMTAGGLVITFYYILQDLPRYNTVKPFATWHQLPLYFGTAIYAFEGIGMILPLENNMKTPEDFGGRTGVLVTGMVIVIALYTAIGFFGYLKYGEHVRGSITLNLPNDLLAESVRTVMAVAIFLSYGLQFYVPMSIVWPFVKSRLSSEKALKYGESATRVFIVTVTFTAAALIPNLSGIISLVGAFSSSALALIFPPLIEIITFWPDRLGKYDWKLWKDIFIIIFGLTGFIFGTYASIENILNHKAHV